jgi:hypothetical protein
MTDLIEERYRLMNETKIRVMRKSIIYALTCIRDARGIYFLFDKEECVYIGMSDKNLFRRIKDHVNEFDFVDFGFFEMSEYSRESIFGIERDLIKKFEPLHNNR